MCLNNAVCDGECGGIESWELEVVGNSHEMPNLKWKNDIWDKTWDKLLEGVSDELPKEK